MAKRILVLDDMTHRVDWLKRRTLGHDVHHRNTVQELREALPQVRPHLVILDYDLGPGSHTSEDRFGQTGLTAAMYAEIPFDTLVLIWSQNDTGAKAMEAILDARRIPCVRVRFDRPRDVERVLAAVLGWRRR